MSMGAQSHLGIDTTTPVTKGYEMVSESVAKRGSILDGSGLRGSYSHRSERTREGNKAVGGTIVMEPSPEELALLLPWILGAVASGTTFALGDTPLTRYVVIDKIAKVFTYSGAAVARAVFSGSEGSLMTLSLDILALDEAVANSGTFPSVTYQNTAPFQFADCALTILSTTRQVKTWSVTVDNGLIPIYNNSVIPTSIKRQDRHIMFSCQNPFTSAEVDLYNQALAGGAASLVLTNAGYSLEFDFAALQFPQNTPVVPGRVEIPTNLDGESRMASTTEALVVILDSTP